MSNYLIDNNKYKIYSKAKIDYVASIRNKLNNSENCLEHVNNTDNIVIEHIFIDTNYLFDEISEFVKIIDEYKNKYICVYLIYSNYICQYLKPIFVTDKNISDIAESLDVQRSTSLIDNPDIVQDYLKENNMSNNSNIKICSMTLSAYCDMLTTAC